ncbi:MAG TPA: NAD(P)-dependent oxidoreductase [Nanoarchaeota archaeon]|nr:NAD(P)-dependent oxidoreductase [Nanoarchaeota archaeon]
MDKRIRERQVLVTGCGGFVGYNLLNAMQALGYTNIRATDIALPKNLPAGIQFMKSDVTDKASLEAVLEGCHGVIHVADLFDFFASKEQLFAVNVQGTKNICEAAIDNHVTRMVRFSSGSIYKAGFNCNEESPLQPIDQYAESKMKGEKAASEYNGDKGFKIALLRPAVIFGEGSRYGAARIFMTQALMAKLLGMKLLPGDGNCKGPYVHVDDVVNAALHIYEHEGLFTGSRTPSDMAYNINAMDAVSPREIAEMADVNVKKTMLAKLIRDLVPAEYREMHVTRGIMDPVAMACAYGVKALIKAGIIKRKPGAMLEPSEVDFMFCHDLTMDCGKIIAAGYEPMRTCSGDMPETIRGLDRQGWYGMLM